MGRKKGKVRKAFPHGCHTEDHKMGGLKKCILSTVLDLEARSLKSRYWQGHALSSLQAFGENLSCLFLGSDCCQLVNTALQSLPLSSFGPLPCVSISVFKFPSS